MKKECSWEEIICFESLYRAHRRARLGKRHKKEVILFELNLSQNLWELHYDLKYRRYRPSGYHSFMIFDPKKREIQAISYRDRIVQHALCDNYFMPLLERKLIFTNVACRKEKGIGLARSRLRKDMSLHFKHFGASGYFVKADVSKYFNSIDHDVLKRLIAANVSDENIAWLLNLIVDSYNFDENKGLPMGNQTSQCFGLFYLDVLDRALKETLHTKIYIRYMDDIVILVPEKQQAVNCLKVIKNTLRTVNLKCNPKSQVISLKNGIEFLGWRYLLLPKGRLVQKLRQSTRKRIANKLRTGNLPNISCTLASYLGFLSQGNAYLFSCTVKKLCMEKATPELLTV